LRDHWNSTETPETATPEISEGNIDFLPAAAQSALPKNRRI